MNFQSVKAAPGQYIQLQAAIAEIKHFDGDYGPYALGKAQDNQGFVEDVFFTIKKGTQFPTGLAAGHSCNWAGKYDANTGKMKLFFGNMAQRDVAAQAPVQTPPQSSPVPPQQANIPIHVPVGPDATRVSIERQCAWKAACGIAASRPQRSLAEMLDEISKVAYRGTQFMADGKDIPTMGQQYDDQGPPIDDSDVPF